MLGQIAYAYGALYWDGERIGHLGRDAPHAGWLAPRWLEFPVPVSLAAAGQILIDFLLILTGAYFVLLPHFSTMFFAYRCQSVYFSAALRWAAIFFNSSRPRVNHSWLSSVR